MKRRSLKNQWCNQQTKKEQSDSVELQSQLNTLQDQNNKLQEEVKYWKSKYIELKFEFEETVSKLEKNEAKTDNSNLNELQIKRNYEQLMNSISAIKDKTRDIITKREERISYNFKQRTNRLLMAEHERIESSNNQSRDKEIERLRAELDLMGTKCLYFETMNNELIAKNKEIRTQLSLSKSENIALMDRLRSRKRASWSKKSVHLLPLSRASPLNK